MMHNCEAAGWAMDRSLPGPLKIVLVAVADLSVDGLCTAPQAEVAERSGYSPRQLRRILAQLCLAEYGFLSREIRPGKGKGRQTDAYRLSMPEQQAAKLTRCQSDPLRAVILTETDAKNAQEVNLTDDRLSRCVEPEAIGHPPHTPQVSSPTSKIDAVVVAADAGQRVDWNARLEEARDRAGRAVDAGALSARHYRDLKRLCEPAAGIPCDWEADVLPAIDKITASFLRKRQTFRAWTIIEQTALEFRDRRLEPLPAPQPQSELFSDAAGADNVEHFDVERTRQDHRKPQSGQRGAGRRSPESPFDELRNLADRVREGERWSRADAVDQPGMRYLGGA